jgi:hypothetical protein
LDKRLISDVATPSIASMLNSCRSVSIRTIPNTELVPTLLSGVYPHQNGVWQVSLETNRNRTVRQRLTDAIPDLVATTVQCIRQKFDPEFDLATIPPNRRRDFVQHRFKYTRRASNPDSLHDFNGYKTMFGLLGADSRYRFTSDFSVLDSLTQDLLASTLRLEFIEMYALDLYQHWHHDDGEGMRRALAQTDRFVQQLLDGCSESDRTLILLSDHGQEKVVGTIPILQALRGSGVPPADYTYYCELACCRIWFYTEQARKHILEILKELPNCTPLHYRDMHEYDVSFDEDSFGEYYLMADAGYIFFPHDFYHPIANLYLGLFGHSQRSRLLNPVHRANHGYLPHYPSEKGFLLIADDNLKVNREQMSLIDFAPTTLNLLGIDIPSYMKGSSVI